MPVLNGDEEQNKNKQNQIGGGSSYIGGGLSSAAPQAQQTSPQTQTPGSGFVNIGNYLANSDGGQKMASTIAGKADTLGGEAETAIGAYAEEGNKQIAAGTPSFDPTVADQWLKSTQWTDQGVKDINNGGKPGTVTFGATVPTGEYTGPGGYSEIGGFSGAQSATKAADDWNNMGKNATGVQTQLKDVVKDNRYSTGENQLDSAITRSGPGSQILSNSQDTWGGINGYLGGTNNEMQSAIDGAKSTAKTVSGQWAKAGQDAQDQASATNTMYGKLANTVAKRHEDDIKRSQTPVKTSPMPTPSATPRVIRSPVAPNVGTLAIDPTLDGSNLDYSKYGTKKNPDEDKWPLTGALVL